jgi:hypothetical protein
MGDVSGGGMIRRAACAAAGAILVLSGGWASAAAEAAAPAPAPAPEVAKRLVQGCLAEPSAATTAQLAGSVGATAYPEVRNKRALTRRDTATLADVEHPGEADRIDAEITAFQGWLLPGSGGGQLAYVEESFKTVKIELATGQAVGAMRASRSRACTVNAPVASGRTVFEAYEAMHGDDYGALITPDRRHVIVFRFKPDAYDIELDIGLNVALPGAPIGSEKDAPSRVVLSDGGARFINGVMPGVASVTLTRAAFLAGLDQPATLGFANSVMEAVASPPSPPPPAPPKPAGAP